MPVTSITYQPATGQLIAAYRPIVFKVQATATSGGITPPYVVCDIYLVNTYYKSLIRTAPESIESTFSVFQFNIMDALQEYMQADLATINNNDLLKAPHSSAKVFCRFRSSDVDGDGFTVEETTAPVQGTKNTSPVSGTGTQSNTFFAINSALQHEDNQNLALHLASYKQGSWATDAFPLTHRNRYFFCPGDSDHFPLIYTGDCVQSKILLHYRLKGQTSFTQAEAIDINVCAAIPFETEVTGNRVDVHLESDPDPNFVLVQYKKQADSVWIGSTYYSTQDFFFYVNGEDLAGDYDIRVIRFCTACLSSDPETGTFALDGTSVNLAWRGIDPFCVQQVLPQTIYISLELRDQTIDIEAYPNNVDPISRTTTTKSNLYAKFFSDANLLNPLTVNIEGLKVYVKQKADNTYFVPNVNVIETINTYIVDAAGTEVLLDNLITELLSESWSGGYFFITYRYTFSPYPSAQLVGGNTGEKGYATLQQYNTDTNLPTGTTKPNDEGDPDYIEPSEDTTTCPNGADTTTVTLGNALQVFTINLYSSGSFITGTTAISYNTGTIDNTYSGGWTYVFPLTKSGRSWSVRVHAQTLDGGNTSGFIKCRVTYISGGVTQVGEFDVPNNLYTPLGQLFQNIVSVSVTNY